MSMSRSTPIEAFTDSSLRAWQLIGDIIDTRVDRWLEHYAGLMLDALAARGPRRAQLLRGLGGLRDLWNELANAVRAMASAQAPMDREVWRLTIERTWTDLRLMTLALMRQSEPSPARSLQFPVGV